MCIPRYFLYGEPLQEVGRRFVHIEPVSKRCRQRNGCIEPHSHPDLDQLVLIQRGGGVIRMEAISARMAAPALARIPRGCVHAFDLEPESEGWVFSLSTVLLDLITTDYPELLPLFRDADVVELKEDSTALPHLDGSFSSLAAELAGDAPARRPALASALVTLLVDALRISTGAPTIQAFGCNRDSALVTRFKTMLENTFKDDIGIVTYAERLCVSQERLRRACIRITGSPPVALLAARRLLEAKRGLLYTTMSLARIAAHCGFENPAYFSRFFAQHTGESPRVFRARRQAAEDARVSRLSPAETANEDDVSTMIQ